MDPTPYALMTVAFAGLIQSGFSLGTGMLTLMSGHSLSRRRSHARVLRLTGAFVAGSFAMTALLILALTYAGMFVFGVTTPVSTLVLATMTMLAGLWVTFFYYRRSRDGTTLWLPRSFARYLSDRTARTKTASESFVLGGASVLYELPVTVWLILIAAVTVPYLSLPWQIPAAIGYALCASASLILVFILIGGGHTNAALTRFRARHKRFIQVLVGASMLLLGAAVFWNEFASVVLTRSQP